MLYQIAMETGDSVLRQALHLHALLLEVCQGSRLLLEDLSLRQCIQQPDLVVPSTVVVDCLAVGINHDEVDAKDVLQCEQ